MEIERKFLVSVLPEDYDHHSSHQIEQAYLSTDPVVRIRKEDDQYYLTYKSFSGHYKGLMLVEVEFETEEQANAFVPPEWFGKDVTFSGEYQNSRLASI